MRFLSHCLKVYNLLWKLEVTKFGKKVGSCNYSLKSLTLQCPPCLFSFAVSHPSHLPNWDKHFPNEEIGWESCGEWSVDVTSGIVGHLLFMGPCAVEMCQRVLEHGVTICVWGCIYYITNWNHIFIFSFFVFEWKRGSGLGVGWNWLESVCVCALCVCVCVQGTQFLRRLCLSLSLSLTEAHCSRSRDGNGAFGIRRKMNTHALKTHIQCEQEEQLFVTLPRVY